MKSLKVAKSKDEKLCWGWWWQGWCWSGEDGNVDSGKVSREDGGDEGSGSFGMIDFKMVLCFQTDSWTKKQTNVILKLLL